MKLKKKRYPDAVLYYFEANRGFRLGMFNRLTAPWRAEAFGQQNLRDWFRWFRERFVYWEFLYTSWQIRILCFACGRRRETNR